MSDFNFLIAPKWMELEAPIITFWGCSGHYKDMGDVKYIMWEGWHVATKFGAKVVYNPKAIGKLPRGFKSACNDLN